MCQGYSSFPGLDAIVAEMKAKEQAEEAMEKARERASRVTCEYCHSVYSKTKRECPNCGASPN